MRVGKPELRPHQMEALSKLGDGKILWGGVGVGKSAVAIAYYKITEEHEDLYVITTAKKRDTLDWESEASWVGIGKERDGTVAGVLTVDSWNNLHKYVGVENAFFIFDEQRLVGNGQWVKSFLKIAKKNRWIMLSATPGDTWMDYIPVFVANGFYKNRTAFKAEHVILKPHVQYDMVDRYVNVHKLIKYRHMVLVHMPYEKRTVRNEITCWMDYNTTHMTRVQSGRWNIYENQPIKEVGEYFSVLRRVVNSDPSRMVQLRKLIKKHPRLIVYYNFNYELEMIREMASVLPFAEWNGHKHEELPKGKHWLYAVQYVAGAEGWNCTQTDAMAFWSLPYSYKSWEQARGRIDRLDTKYRDLYYYSFRSRADIDLAIWECLRAKKSFQYKHLGRKFPQFAGKQG